MVELVGAAVVVVAVDPEHAQHVHIVVSPAQVHSVINGPWGNHAGGMSHGLRHGIKKTGFWRDRKSGIRPEHLRLLAIGSVVAKCADLQRIHTGIQRCRVRHIHVIKRILFAQQNRDATIFVLQNGV